MILKRTISKEEVKEMPKAAFPGRIHVIQTESEAQKAVAYLQSQAILGIDSETRPSFTKGHSHKVALLQISSDECCFLFRLNMTGLTQPIIELLEDPKVIKVGLSLKDDFMMLHKRAPFNQQACIELQEYVRPFGIQDKSLQKIYGILFSEKISKSQRLSNWEADVLTDAQSYRCLGLPQHISLIGGTETNRKLRIGSGRGSHRESKSRFRSTIKVKTT